MNGAQAMIRTLADAGVDVCFTNPGTSEMHFVAALDSVPEMRGVLGLFEGVATGAADGYARMAGKPAGVLLHLGPGLGNGLANLHNARKGRVPIVNIVGDHATYHKQYDAQLESDIVSVANNVSDWIRTSAASAEIGRDTAEAVAAAMGPPGQVATLILPADVSWGDGGQPASPVAPAAANPVDDDVITGAAKALASGEPCLLLLGRRALDESGIRRAAAIAATGNARVIAETFPTRIARGAGRVNVDRLGYLAEMASEQLKDVKHLILIDAKAPVTFFAYPDKDSYLVPEGCQVHALAGPSDDVAGALAALVDLTGADVDRSVPDAPRAERPSGALDAMTAAQAIGALMPEGAIVSDESNTSSLVLPMTTAGSPPHDWMTLTGGAIGQGLPLATGAAIACPDRPVLALQADGSAMYTIQALWTQAREGCNVTTVLYNNRSYEILKMELSRVGAEEAGPKAKDLFDLSRPELDFVKIASGMGVPATRATTAEEFTDQLEAALAEPGPSLVEAMIPGMF